MSYVWDELDWTHERPEKGGDMFPRLEAVPAPGTHVWVRVHGTFDAPSPFRALFQPALSSLNGWSVHPQELLESALVECKLIEARSGRRETWLHVDVQAVTPLTELEPPEEAEAPALDWLKMPHRARGTAPPLHYFEADFESDVGGWAVCREDFDGLRLLLSNRWTFSDHETRLGNSLLTEEQAQALLAFPEEDY